MNALLTGLMGQLPRLPVNSRAPSAPPWAQQKRYGSSGWRAQNNMQGHDYRQNYPRYMGPPVDPAFNVHRGNPNWASELPLDMRMFAGGTPDFNEAGGAQPVNMNPWL